MMDRTARVIAVTSGKGGIGKTNVSVNLAVALARSGAKTMLIDQDHGTANANILIGLSPGATLGDVITRDSRLDEIVARGPGGLFFVPGHNGTALGTRLSSSDRRHLGCSLRPYADEFDHVVVDTGAGISAETLATVAASDLVLLVLGDEPTAFMDAYAAVKSLSLRHGCIDISVVANMVTGEAEGRALFDRFNDIVSRFLPVKLTFLGAVPQDHHIPAAVYARRCCVDAYPHAPASAAFARIARAIAGRTLPPLPGGNRFFGMETAHGAH